MQTERPALEIVRPDIAVATEPALLFVHGARHGAWCWQEHFLPYFAAAGFAAWALSVRGHGASEGRAGLSGYTLDDYVDDAASVLAQLPGRPVLIGHSLGGAIVQRLLVTHGERLRAAVLMASVPPNGVGRQDPRGSEPRKRRDRARLIAHSQGRPVPFPDRIFFSATLPAAERERHVARIQPESPLIQRDIRGPIVAGPRRPGPPVLVLGAGHDWFLSRGAVRRTARFHGTRPRFFADMAHDMMLEPGWRAVADAIIAFLRALP